MNTAKPSADFYRYRFLMGAMHQNALAMTVRQACIPDDVARLDDVIQAWRGASARMVALGKTEAGLPDRIEMYEPPQSIHTRLHEIEKDRLFRASFSNVPTSFKVVDADHLVAPQREVNLDYVDMLRDRIPGKSVEELTEFCVGPRTEPPELKALQTAQN